MSVEALDRTIQAQATRDVSIQIVNSSGTEADVQTFLLTGGSWKEIPQAGQPITPGANQTYNNYTSQPFTNLGGTLTLTPTTGGTVTITWNWAWGGLCTGSATATNTSGIAVSSSIINPNTSSPTLQVTLVNAPKAKG